jgi:hypothetical protein
MALPDWLHEMEDGLYGAVDVLLESFQEGRELEAWNKQVADNALSDVKIACWLHSDSYHERHNEPEEILADGPPDVEGWYLGAGRLVHPSAGSLPSV